MIYHNSFVGLRLILRTYAPKTVNKYYHVTELSSCLATVCFSQYMAIWMDGVGKAWQTYRKIHIIA